MLLLAWLILIGYGSYNGIAQDEPSCKTNDDCSCCKSNPDDGTRKLLDICENQITGWKCKYGCKVGYWSDKCWNYCPSNCINCDQNYHLSYMCYSCNDGYYGTNCSSNCPTNCALNKCDQTTGNCLLGCINNWTGNKCNICPDYCRDRVCDRNGGCTYGCVNEILDESKCNQCKASGKYGDNCDIDCPVNCKYDICRRDDGKCTDGCKDNFNGDKCDKCKSNYYGATCDKQCFNCLNGACNRSTGGCTECAVGKYGEQCDQPCSYYCMNSICDRNTAVCQQGCQTGYSGDKCCVNTNGCELCDKTTSCLKCRSGFYKHSCEKYCPSNCSGACDKETGNCNACKDEKLYGDKCDTPCPSYCLDGQCDKIDGRCSSCVTGFYGDQCSTQCPSNCLDGQCTQKDGRCMSCKVGYFGQTCTETCPTNCDDNMCGQNNGVCNNCIAGFHGDACNKICKRYDCINNTCSQITGLCSIGFINGCEEPQCLCYTGEIIGGFIAAVVILFTLNNVIWFVWTRRNTKERKKDSTTHANAIYENDQADHDGYEELQISRH